MFSFSMSKQQKMVKSEVANLVKKLVTDNALEMDEKKEIPADAIQKAWELGASISKVPEEFGGFGMQDSPIESTIVLEELAYGDMAFTIAVMQPSLFISPILELGTDEQKKKYLPLYCKEQFTPCSCAVNEPHFGFDAANMKTIAEKKNNAYVLNGTKCVVPLASKSKHMLVAANLDGAPNLFIVSADNPGLKVGERERNIGLYALETNKVTLENCEVSADDRVGGAEGCNFSRFLQKSRIAMSAIGTGVSRASYDYAREYAKERVQFGEPIAHRQAVAFMIAEMAYEVDAMRLLTWQAASKIENGKDAKREAYLAKIYTGDKTMHVTDYGVQVMGGHGYIRDYPVERYYRNGRGISTLEGVASI
ncbi:MAG: acyl-CoA dehydrogenase family protein [Proteobacteria bacterium]|nr:acyl-CoA dehydrogenase family protein [Pseudomonadota bacterium]